MSETTAEKPDAASGALPGDGLLQLRPRDGGLVVRHAPPIGFRGRAAAAIDAARLLERARRHETLHARTDTWARVGAVWSAAGITEIELPGAAATLAAFPAGDIVPRANDLHAFVGRLVEALEAHRELLGGLPASVRARDVLLSDRSYSALARAQLMLLGLPEITGRAAEDTERELLRSIGVMLGRLVEGWDDIAPVRPPLRGGPQWDRIGRSGDRWLELVNALLDPERGREPATLAALRERRPREPRSRRPLMVAASVLIVGGAVVAGVTLAGERSLDEKEVDDLRIQLVFLGESYPAWFDDLVLRARDAGGSVEEWLALPEDAPENLVASVASLRTSILDPVREALGEDGDEDPFNPLLYFAGVPDAAGLTYPSDVALALESDGRLVRSLLEQDSGRVRASVQQPILRAAATVRRTAAALRAWRERDDAAAVAAALEARGWTAQADRLAAPLSVAEGDVPAPDAVVIRVRRMIAATNALREIARIDARVAEGNGPAASIARDWAAAVQRAVAAQDDPDAALPIVVAATEELLVMVGHAADGGTVTDWTEAESDGLPFAAPATAALEWFETWRQTAATYRRVQADPEGILASFDDDLRGIQDILADIREYAAEGGADVQAQITALRAAKDEFDGIPAIARERDVLASTVVDLGARVQEVRDRATREYELVAVPPSQYLDEQRAIVFGDRSLQRVWGEGLDRAEGAEWSVPSDGAVPAAAEEYFQFRDETTSLLGMLQSIDQERLPAGLRVPADFDGFDPGSFVAAAATARANLLREAAGAVEDTMNLGGVANPADQDFLTAVADLEQEWMDWHEAAERLVADHAAIARGLDEGFDLDEPLPDGRVVRAIDEQWRPADGTTTAMHDALGLAVRVVTRRVAGLRAIEAATDDQEILDAVGADPAVERVVAGWRRLAAVSVAEPVARIEATRSLDRQLARSLGRVSAERRVILEAERVATGADRWTAVVRAGRGRALLETALEAVNRVDDPNDAGPFHIDPRDLEPDLRWNVMADGIARSLTPALVNEEAAARELLVPFLAEARDLAGAIGSTTVDALLDELDELAGGTDPVVDFAEAGPAASRPADGGDSWWTYIDALEGAPVSAGGPPKTLVYRCRPNARDLDEVDITFRIVPNGSPDRPVYLATEETSVLLARILARQGQLVSRIGDDLVAGRGPRDMRVGPRAWVLTPDGDDFVDDLWYDSGAKSFQTYRNADATPGKPRPNHPFQFVSEGVAVILAAELGCRLPTPDEFLRAMIAEVGFADADQLQAALADGTWPANVRDQRVAGQREWAIAEAERERVDSFRPEIEAFGSPAEDFATSGDAARALPFASYDRNDGTLWFREVHDDPAVAGREDRELPPFRHIVGNVAELVLDLDGLGFQLPRAADADRPGESAGAINTMDFERAVMGGSALGSPNIDPFTAVPFTDSNLRGDRERGGGWSDVGFRLAFAPTGRFTTVAAYASTRLRESLIVP